MQDDDDELEGLSPTSTWKRSKKRKDYSDDEDYVHVDGEDEEEEEEEEEDEDDEEDNKCITNAKYKGKLCPSPIPIAMVRAVSPPPQKRIRQTARISAGGKVPRRCLASRNPITNLHHREYEKVPIKDLPGEWDHHLPKKKAGGSTPDWKPCKDKVEKMLWEDLAKSTKQFQPAYDLMMSVVKDLQIHHDSKMEKKKG